MTLLIETPGQTGRQGDTQPFDFVGRDSWGQNVRGSIVALDAADAFARLLARRIEADALNERPLERAPYRPEVSVVSGPSPRIAELVRRMSRH